MFRQYENPHELEERLESLRERFERAKIEEPENEDYIIDLYIEVAELEDRINFAYQDEEYDEMYADNYGDEFD